VHDCAVLGLPDERWGETVAAVVASPVAAAGFGEELRARARESLAGYKVPRTVVVVEALPRTPTGKLELARARRILLDRTAPAGPP
jgi:3-oxocholest-4-en-26-oate---CoA ligase